MVRQKAKELQRREFDELVEQLQRGPPNSKNDDIHERLSLLTSKMVFFYNQDKDVKRLVSYFTFFIVDAQRAVLQ